MYLLCVILLGQLGGYDYYFSDLIIQLSDTSKEIGDIEVDFHQIVNTVDAIRNSAKEFLFTERFEYLERQQRAIIDKLGDALRPFKVNEDIIR